MSLRAKRNAGSEVPAFAIQGLLHPLDVAAGLQVAGRTSSWGGSGEP